MASQPKKQCEARIPYDQRHVGPVPTRKKWIIRDEPVKPVPVHNLPAPHVTGFYTLCKPDDVPKTRLLRGPDSPSDNG